MNLIEWIINFVSGLWSRIERQASYSWYSFTATWRFASLASKQQAIIGGLMILLAGQFGVLWMLLGLDLSYNRHVGLIAAYAMAVLLAVLGAFWLNARAIKHDRQLRLAVARTRC